MEQEPETKNGKVEQEQENENGNVEQEQENKNGKVEQEQENENGKVEQEQENKNGKVLQEYEKKGAKMEKEHFETLEEDYLFLCRNMMKHPTLFITYLTEEEIVMGPETKEDIMDEVSHFKRAQKMLDFLMERNDEKAFSALYNGCLNAHLWKAADILMPENAPHEPEEEEDIVEHLPETWPSDSHFESIKDPTKLELKPCGPNMKATYQLCIKGDSEMYNMSRKDKGRLVIIDNEKFVNSKDFPRREGSKTDASGLTYLFSHLGFEVHQERNMKAEVMRTFLKNEAAKLDELTRCSCFILAIMTYGFEGSVGLYGTDGVKDEGSTKGENYILMADIKKMFTRLTPLANRPKVFLIVAHQTDNRYQQPHPRPERPKHPAALHAKLPDSVNFMPKMESFAPSFNEIPHHHRSMKHHDISYHNFPKAEIAEPMKKIPESLNINFPKITLKHCDIAREIAHDGMTQFDGIAHDGMTQFDGDPPPTQETIPSDADIFQVVVTPRDMLRHHDEYVGTWFIQAFIFVMANYGHQKHLREIFEKVNELSANQRWRMDQHCVPNFTANKKLYFFPHVLSEE